VFTSGLPCGAAFRRSGRLYVFISGFLLPFSFLFARPSFKDHSARKEFDANIHSCFQVFFSFGSPPRSDPPATDWRSRPFLLDFFLYPLFIVLLCATPLRCPRFILSPWISSIPLGKQPPYLCRDAIFMVSTLLSPWNSRLGFPQAPSFFPIGVPAAAPFFFLRAFP